jgi:hypothetical protein
MLNASTLNNSLIKNFKEDSKIKKLSSTSSLLNKKQQIIQKLEKIIPTEAT